MKMKLFGIFVLILILVGCGTTNRYQLREECGDKNLLINLIDMHYKEKLIGMHPLIVLNGKPYRYEFELKEDKLPVFDVNSISEIKILKRETGIQIYGGYANEGVILIQFKEE